jgi:hypothetical protein
MLRMTKILNGDIVMVVQSYLADVVNISELPPPRSPFTVQHTINHAKVKQCASLRAKNVLLSHGFGDPASASFMNEMKDKHPERPTTHYGTTRPTTCDLIEK